MGSDQTELQHCRLCGSVDLKAVVDLGTLPVSRPHQPREEEELRHPLAVHSCISCGLLQVVNPIAPELLYVDAENYTTSFQVHPHVDELIRTVLAHSEASSAIEIGCNDGGFLTKLRTVGFRDLVGVEPNRTAAEIARSEGLTVYNSLLTADLARQIAANTGQYDLVIARHVVEHVVDLRAFFDAVHILLNPGGRFLLELPHVEPGLFAGNPCLLWEEHVNYFTEPVILRMLGDYGYLPEVKRYYTFGGGIIAFLARNQQVPRVLEPQASIPWHQIDAYAKSVATFRDQLREVVNTAVNAGWEIAVYGAANRSNVVINHAQIGSQIDWVIDDRPDLAGQIFPGVAQTIQPLSNTPASARGLLCLLGVGAEVEARVAARVRAQYPLRLIAFSSLVYPRDALSGFRNAAAAIRQAARGTALP